MTNSEHQPVMLEEAISALTIKPEKWFVDATFGRGGHTAAILEKNARVVAFDWDAEAIQAGQTKFSDEIEQGKLILNRSSFANLAEITKQVMNDRGIDEIAGILFDFGTSTNQLMSTERGFSFNQDGPLDMRMDQRLGVTAADLLAVIPENQLAELFADAGGEMEAKRIAKAIKHSPQPITTTSQLSQLISQTKRRHSGHLHPATKVFQALRIAVNSELDEISIALPQALKLIKSEGKIVTIAFHEGEDRIVKQLFKKWTAKNKGEIETKKPMVPSEQELNHNPRARSAKLRVFRKN